MGSVSNQNPWRSYDSHKDCSQGLCSLYCPQWCYVLTPPPPYFPGYTQNEHSRIDFSPLFIAIIGILTSVLLLICYYILISKYCMTRSNRDTGLEFSDYHTNAESSQGASTGLDEALIKSITVCKYNKGDGLVKGTECSVCLNNFQENENLKLLPNCNHAFHLPCIDTWLKSNSSCPLCRSNIPATDSLSPQPVTAALADGTHSNVNISAHEFQHRNHTILVIQDVVCQEAAVSIIHDVCTKTLTQASRNLYEAGNTTRPHAIQSVRRSLSMNSLSQDRILNADILHLTDNDDEIQVENPYVSIEIESSKHPEDEPGKSDDKKGNCT